MEDIDIIATTHSTLLPSLDCGQPTVKMAVQVKKKEISPQRSTINKMPSVTSTKKKVKSPPGFSSKQNVKVLPGQGKQIIPKAEEQKPRAIPPPPPMPPKPASIPLHDLAKKPVKMKPKADF